MNSRHVLSSEHPSSFALDLLWLAPEGRDESVAAHVESCARCRAYLEGLRARREHAEAHAGGALHHAMAFPGGRPLRRAGRVSFGANARRGTFVAAGALALAAGVALFVRRPRPSDEDAYVGAKGTPAVEVLVDRQGRVERWDGTRAVLPGDRIGLRVACESYRFVTVSLPKAGDHSAQILFAARCERSPFALDSSLRVDEAAGDETLVVTFSNEPLAPRDVETPSLERWSLRLRFSKSIPRTP